MEDDDSSDELHIDEGQDYSTSNSNTKSRGIHNTYSNKAGAYNDALLGFGGRRDAAKLNPLLTSSNVSSYVPTGNSSSRYANDLPKRGTRSRNFYKKGARTSGDTYSDYHKNRNIVRATAEQNLSSSNLFSENINMAVPDSFSSYGMTNIDENVFQGVKRSLKIQGLRKR